MIGRQGSPDLIQKMHDLTFSLQWQNDYIEDRSTQATRSLSTIARPGNKGKKIVLYRQHYLIPRAARSIMIKSNEFMILQYHICSCVDNA